MARSALLLFAAARLAAADNCADPACDTCCNTDPAIGLCLPCKPCVSLKIGPCAPCWTVNDTVTPPSACLTDDGSHCQACWADGPAPPAPTPPAPAPPSDAKYQCASGQCAVAATGIELATCQQLCHAPEPPPPPPDAKYQCSSGKCTVSATGIDLATCQQLCHAPAPPPPPADAKYQCASGKCTVSATGIDLATCQQLCHAPAPPDAKYQCASGQCAVSATGIDLATCQQLCHAPAPPGQLYKCVSNQCSAAATGTDLTTCQQLCHAPTPTLPPLPPIPKTCGAGVSCIGCVEAFVVNIAEGVEQCMQARDATCAEHIAVYVYDLVELIVASCATNSSSTLDGPAVSAAVGKLQRLAARSGDKRFQRAVSHLLRSVAAAMPLPRDNTVCAKDLCTADCILTNRKLDFPSTTNATHGMHSVVSGTLSADVTDPVYIIAATFMGVAVPVTPATGPVCVDPPVPVTLDVSGLSTVIIDFSNGGTQKCPDSMKAGSASVTPTDVLSSEDPPMGKFLTTVTVNNGDGTPISILQTQVGGC